MSQYPLSHKDKVKLARRLQTPEELRNRVSIFQTKAWEARKTNIEARVVAKEANQHKVTEIKDINLLQQMIMKAISDWSHKHIYPIPLKEIKLRMGKEGVKDFTTANALNALLKKGYIRRSCVISNKTSFVQLRGI